MSTRLEIIRWAGAGALVIGGLLVRASALAAPPVCVGLSVDTGTQLAGGKTVVTATKVVDVVLQAHLGPGYEGVQVVEFRLFGPDGQMYQSISFPVADPRSTSLKLRSVPGYPRPVKESAAKPEIGPAGQGFKIERNFPVGGTQIVSNGLYGLWTVQAYVNGSGVPACPAASFQILP